MKENGLAGRAVTLDQVPDHAAFSYQEAFARHLGLVNHEEQNRLRSSRVAIAGMGGVGGIHLITLARLGIGAFHIADPDDFELVNFNRQYGATLRSLGRGKAEVMAEEARAVNPDLELRVFSEAITPENVGEFLANLNLSVYAQAFEDEGFDNIAALKMLDLEDLTRMNVKRGHAKQILAGLTTLA